MYITICETDDQSKFDAWNRALKAAHYQLRKYTRRLRGKETYNPAITGLAKKSVQVSPYTVRVPYASYGKNLNPLPLPSPSHPSGLYQCPGLECPASCIKLGLVICFTYGNIHVSMLFSQIIPPSPSPTESKSLFFISVSLLFSCLQGHSCNLSKSH